MKALQLIAILSFSLTSFGQSSTEKALDSVRSVQDAMDFVESHPNLPSKVRTFNSQDDTSAVHKQLYRLKKGEILTTGGLTFKKIWDTIEYAFKASYIYLDGSRLTKDSIDKIRVQILRLYSAGTSFEKLSDEFNMDGNQTHGDMGYFTPGKMVNEMTEAVRKHKNGEVFLVDVPGHKWYYVVKKTAPTQVTHEIRVLQVKGR